jgi:hypothetical protein
MNDDQRPIADDDTPDALPPAWAVNALREAPVVSPAWRRALADALVDERAALASSSVRRLSIRPLMALAAALACVALGSLATLFATAPNAIVAPDRPGASPPVRGVDRDVAETGTVGVRFAVVAAGAQRVSLVGDFNQWNATANLLQRARDGVTWTIMLPLAAGRHTYAFVIDGEVIADPSAPAAADDDYGVPNSMVRVGRWQ